MSYLHTQPIVTQFTEFYSKCSVSCQFHFTFDKSRSYPNPKTNHRFDKTDWADFFDNDYEYEGRGDNEQKSLNLACYRINLFGLSISIIEYHPYKDEERKKRNAKKRKNRLNGHSASSNGQKTRNNRDKVPVPMFQEEPKFQNPPGEFEIGVWRPT